MNTSIKDCQTVISIKIKFITNESLNQSQIFFSNQVVRDVPFADWQFIDEIIQSAITTLWANSADNKCFSYVSQKTGFDFSCKLSPLETICIKYQNLISGKKIRKYFNMSSAENFTQGVKHEGE